MMSSLLSEDEYKNPEEYREAVMKRIVADVAAKRAVNTGVEAEGIARKNDTEKPRLDLLPVDPLIEVGKILTFGAKKYAENNWQGLEVSRCYAATLRHLFAWWNGEDKDEETGLSPIDHAICELMFISWILKHRPEQDNRRKQA